MKLWKYKNYEEYVKVQTDGNVSKLKNIWVDETCIKNIAEIKPLAKNIICHGTRNGTEQKLFKKYIPAAKVIGTEISHTANQFENTIEHDFHNPIKEYIGKFDILYSNSLDHSYDPEKCIKTWIEQINTEGILCIDLAQGREMVSRELDPLEISTDELINMLRHDFKLKYKLSKVIHRPRGINSQLIIFEK